MADEQAEQVTEARVRGLVLGAALGDAAGVAEGRWPGSGGLRVGVATQLAAFTIEGFVRASVRMKHRGICHPPSVVANAYHRWGVLQGIVPQTAGGRPNGWLAEVAALRERRGSAPATVAALRARVYGAPVGGSRGAHAVTRGLALAVPRAISRGDEAFAGTIREIAGLTHGAPDAQEAAFRAADLLARCLRGEDTLAGLSPVLRALPLPGALGALGPDGAAAALLGPSEPSVAELGRFAPEATAVSALLGGLYVFARFPGPETVDEALRFAAGAPDGCSAAAVAGAFLGAVHGVDALPVALLGRLELAWELDTLARDLRQEMIGSPGGGEYVPARDPYWWCRYPGG
ncbi:ADP-ribosylglycohydrolase family protein [Kitasatospora cineracea]|uniref:ADP-ribosylglycohydrolase family protein n=1 Tax=Kitasatospora cineracea TaxID=88074 RepID=UPI003819AE91